MENTRDLLQQVVRHLSANNLHEAEKGCRRILAAEPDDPDALHILGVIAFNVGQFDAAAELIARAITLFPHNPSFYINMGNVHQSRGDLAEAAACYEKCLALAPENPAACSNLGVVYKRLGHLDKAMEIFDAALAFHEKKANTQDPFPLHPDLRLNRAVILLLKGDFGRGWAEFEWRFQSSNRTVKAVETGSPWDGRPFPGKTLLVYEEQGLGDTLQFIRYLPMVRQLGGHVIFEVSPALFRLLQGVDGADRLWIRKDDIHTGGVDRFDLRIPLMSLPGIFNTSLETIPAPVPYVTPDKALSRTWKKRVSPRLSPADGLKVGITWAGSPSHKSDQSRSVKLSAFSGLSRIPGIRLFSLQKDKYPDWTDADPAALFEQDLGEEISDFADTAAVLDNLDLVISVDTSVVHLAGAMGKPVWTLLPHIPDWRWLLDRPDSPWYPGMRLFRQPGRGDWNTVFQQVKTELENFH